MAPKKKLISFEFNHIHLSIWFIIGLVSKVEKNLSDHTEFLNYKNEMDKWLAKANDILDDCGGIGDAQQTQQKLDTVNVSFFFYDHLLIGSHLIFKATSGFEYKF